MGIDTPEKIALARLLVLRSGLALEVKTGLRHSGGSIYAQVKREFGFTGSKKRVLDQLNELISKSTGGEF